MYEKSKRFVVIAQRYGRKWKGKGPWLEYRLNQERRRAIGDGRRGTTREERHTQRD